MYGGTCINIACIPTKTMIVAAEKGWSFDDTMKERGAVTGRLNAKNYKMLADNGVDVIDAEEAHFVSNKVISSGDDRQELTAETIVINTGAVSNVLPILA